MQVKYDEISKAVEEQLSRINLKEESRQNIISESKEAIDFLKEKLTELKLFIQSYSFKNQTEEIEFFKHQKPALVGKLMFYYKVFHIEGRCPPCPEVWDTYYADRQLELKLFFDRHTSFYQYYKSGTTHLDAHYFVRGPKEVCHQTETYDFDSHPEFSTGYDRLAARIVCVEMLSDYLLAKRQALAYPKDQSPWQFQEHKWTGKIVELVELIYALDTRKCIDNGNVKIEELANYLATVFGIEVKNCINTYVDMKRRQGDSRTYFLDDMGCRLNNRMNGDDEKARQ